MLLSKVACSARNEFLPARCGEFLGILELENCKVRAVCVLIFVIPTSSKIVIPFFCELNSALHKSKARDTAQQSMTFSSSIHLDQTSLNYKQGWVLVQQATVCHFSWEYVCNTECSAV